jgi:hypothetical protein
VSGGAIEVTVSFEGLGAAVIEISGGEIRVASSDDGLNASDGSAALRWGACWAARRGPDARQWAGGQPGSRQRRTASLRPTVLPAGRLCAGSALSVTVSGGYVYVDAGGDGIDSNGSLTVTGGTVLVSGPTNSANGALDHMSGNISVSGGVVAAAGASGKAETFDDASGQASLLIVFDTALDAGTAVTLCDARSSKAGRSTIRSR